MAFKRLGKATYVKRGYGQVEPNHLSAQRTAEIYAQLPADATIDLLENGQFVKYDYAKGVVDFTGKGEWMLVYNEVKVYRDRDVDHDFAMIKNEYNARVYSPVADSQTAEGAVAAAVKIGSGTVIDRSEQNLDPLNVEGAPYTQYSYSEQMMPEGATMVPRVFKTHEGDIFTTNTVMETSLAVGDLLSPNAQGYLAKVENADGAFVWEVVKVYSMPDMQPGVKVMRIK